MKKDIKTLQDLLNKYRSELRDLQSKKMDKTINEDKIDKYQDLVSKLETSLYILRKL